MHQTRITTILTLYFTMMFFIGAQSQSLRCKTKIIKISNFSTDSMSTFNSRYVKYGVVNNIKNSQYPIEIRVFSYSSSSQIVDLMMMQGTKDSIFTINKRIWIASKSGVSNYKKIFTGDTFSVNIAERPIQKTANNYCDFFEALVRNNLFTIKGENNEINFISDNNNIIDDGNSFYWIELKIDNNFRNFNYFYNARLTDPDLARANQMKQILTLFKQTLNTKIK